MNRRKLIPLLIFVLALLVGACWSVGAQQEPNETVLHVRTRVVFLDALVKEKRTGASIADLKPENFEVLADGQPRQVSYFTREGDEGRRPLALTIVFDLERLGAGRFLRRTEILEAMAAELAKLPPQDEVAVMALNVGGVDGKREWLTKFTRNRAQVASALAILPTLVAAGANSEPPDETQKRTEETKEQSRKEREQDREKEREQRRAQKETERTARKEKSNKKESASAQDKPAEKSAEKNSSDSATKNLKPGEILTTTEMDGTEVEKIAGKDGSIVTRKVHPDGRVETSRTNKSGSVNVEFDTGTDLSEATYEVTRVTAKERPNAQAAMVFITDGIAPMFYAERDYVEAKLIKSNVIFSALVVDMKTSFKFLMPIAKPIGNWVGLSIYGSAQYLAKETGGEVARVHRPADYASGLSKIVGNLTSRYSLGFTLAESEKDDGVMHPLEVRVRGARDAKGKERKLEVNARRGYYMPENNQDEGGRMKHEIGTVQPE